MKTRNLYNPDVEAALVASALTDFSVFAADVRPSDFHDGALGTLWAIGRELLDSGDYADPITLADACAARGLDLEGRIIRLQAHDADWTHWRSYASRVKDLAERRAALALCERQAKIVHDSNGTWKQELAAVGAQLLQSSTPAPTTDNPPRQTSWGAAELLTAQFPEAKMIVNGLVPVGLTFLAGRPKIGKSWLALQTAIAVAAGGRVLDRAVEHGNVLYLAMEDNARRLQERTRKLGMPATAAIRFELAWPYLTHDGLDLLERAIAEHGYTLVVLDTLGRLLGAADQQDLADMTMIVGRLQEIALARDLAVLALDHHKKPTGVGGGNPIDDIIGSTAKSAVADAALGLFRENGQRDVTLKVVGRDVEWQDLVLSFDAARCMWQCMGTSEEVAQQGNRGRIVAALRDSGRPLTATDLEKEAGIGRTNIHPLLNELVNDGLVERLPKEGRDAPYRLRAV